MRKARTKIGTTPGGRTYSAQVKPSGAKVTSIEDTRWDGKPGRQVYTKATLGSKAKEFMENNKTPFKTTMKSSEQYGPKGRKVVSSSMTKTVKRLTKPKK